MKADWFLLPRNPLNGAFVALVAVGLLIGCNKNPAGTRAGGDSQGSTTTPELSSPTRTDGADLLSLDNLAQTLRNARSVGQYQAAKEKFRIDLVSVAEREASKPMALAARLILENESDDDREMVFHLVLDAFRDLESQITLANELPAGRLRAGVIHVWANRLELEFRDPKGLQTLYDSIPVGAPRTDVGQAAARLTMAVSGLPAALDYIAALEMPEERFAAYREVVTRENLKPFADDKEIEAKRRAIIETFDKQHRELYSYLWNQKK